MLPLRQQLKHAWLGGSWVGSVGIGVKFPNNDPRVLTAVEVTPYGSAILRGGSSGLLSSRGGDDSLLAPCDIPGSVTSLIRTGGRAGESLPMWTWSLVATLTS